MATAIVASKLGVRVAHVEAGLRSFDRGMPEEINRLITDRLADLLLTPSQDADVQLLAEGESADKIVFVGNVMIDSLMHALPRAAATGFADRHGADGRHVVVTLHRPSNVDDEARLLPLAAALSAISRERAVYFPAHPRTRDRLQKMAVDLGAVRLMEPIPYFEMVDLVRGSHAVITDSGGLQEETTALGIPCFTVRDNTERPATITHGTNQLVRDIGALPALVAHAARPQSPRRPDGWDGQAGARVAQAFLARP
jgi:UDP-N-acetylglucosamine 2-epimerase (non-hydrolysing)